VDIGVVPLGRADHNRAPIQRLGHNVHFQ
jgi:hypothetical protein